MRWISSLLPMVTLTMMVAASEEQGSSEIVKRQHLAMRRIEGNGSMEERGSSSLDGLGQVFSGDATFFSPGLNYCHGTHSDSSDMIVAASKSLFDQWGGGTESKLCGKKVKLTSGGKSVQATITDQCPAAECTTGSLDLSPAVFKQLADLSVGRLTNLKWAFVDGDDGGSSGSQSFKAAKASGSKSHHKSKKAAHHKQSHKKKHNKHKKHASHKAKTREEDADEELEDCDP